MVVTSARMQGKDPLETSQLLCEMCLGRGFLDMLRIFLEFIWKGLQKGREGTEETPWGMKWELSTQHSHSMLNHAEPSDTSALRTGESSWQVLLSLGLAHFIHPYKILTGHS